MSVKQARQHCHRTQERTFVIRSLLVIVSCQFRKI